MARASELLVKLVSKFAWGRLNAGWVALDWHRLEKLSAARGACDFVTKLLQAKPELRLGSCGDAREVRSYPMCFSTCASRCPEHVTAGLEGIVIFLTFFVHLSIIVGDF